MSDNEREVGEGLCASGVKRSQVFLTTKKILGWISPLPVDSPSGPAGSVKTAAFTLGDQRYMAIGAGPLDPSNHSFSIMVECDTQAEILLPAIARSWRCTG